MLSPDFVKLAEAYGIPAFRVTSRNEIPEAVAKAEIINGPTVVEFRVEKADVVYPMVPAVADLNAMITRPGATPAFSEAEKQPDHGEIDMYQTLVALCLTE